MKNLRTPGRRTAAAVAVLSLMLQPLTNLTAAAAIQGQPPPAPAPASSAARTQPAPTSSASAAAATPTPIDGGWPRMYTLPSAASILIYQPQVASWEKQAHLVAFSAVSHRSTAGDKPALGTIKIEAVTKVALEDRLVNFQQMKIVEANFPTLPKEQVREITAAIDQAIPDDERVIALDRVLANVDKSQILPKNVEGIKADPPTIFFSKTPAVIVNLDGEPIWSPIKGNDLKYAVNTNWDLFQHEPTKVYFLRNNGSWLKATDVKGPWSASGKLPDSFTKLPADENWKDVTASVPGKPIAASAVPKVFVSFSPAELVLLTGEPKYIPVQGTALLWVSNTETDVFRMGKTGAVYYLVTGRWFTAPDFTGPWTFATVSLPADFKKIPVEHERSRVLASVPGTDQAAEAVLLAQIPQTARVSKKETKAPDVAFQGDPQFQPVEKTTVERAVNTDKDVFKVGDAVLHVLPGGMVRRQERDRSMGGGELGAPGDLPDSPGLSGSPRDLRDGRRGRRRRLGDVCGGCGLHRDDGGLGLRGVGHRLLLSAVLGVWRLLSFLLSLLPDLWVLAWYNPWTGAYGRSAGIYGPYGGAGVGARYNPRTGTYARGAAAYGPYGARGVAQVYNPRTGTYAATRQGSNVYGSWGSTAVQRGDDWAKTNRYTNRQTGTTTRTIRTDEGSAITKRGAGGGAVGVGDGGNVYAGNDGNVYRRQDGTWQKYDNGGWSNTDRQPGETPRPTPTDRATTSPTGDRSTSAVDRSTSDQLDRDSAARREGSQRTGDYGTYRSGSGTGGTGSFRGGGGGRGGGRGGGGRRR